jgi:hypothetical protein
MRQSVMTASQIYETMATLQNNVRGTQEAMDMVAKEIGAGSSAFVIVKRAHALAQSEFTNFINKTFKEV